MKKYSLLGISLLVSLTCLISGCNKSKISIIGEYEFEDVVYVGISSSTIDALIEMNSGKKYIIESDSLKIIDNDSEALFLNISYEEEKMNEKSIQSMHGNIDERLIDFFDKYEDEYRYSLYDEQGEKISYCIYLMDDEVFISQFAKKENLIFSIDKLTKIE